MEDDEEGGNKPARSNTESSAGPAMGPVYLMWEGALEKLKILDYEISYCTAKGKKPFSRVHFVFPGANLSHQFDDFVDICTWLFSEITKDANFFKREQFDDPNTVANKLILALRQLDFRMSFPAQKLKVANGEPVCSVLEFLTDKALSSRNFKWGQPVYVDSDKIEQVADTKEEDEDIDIEEDVFDAKDIDDDVYNDAAVAANAMDDAENSLNASAHQILQPGIDPIAWKTELERVGPKLKSQQIFSANEWRSHVDQTVTNKGHIDKVLDDTKGDLRSMNTDVSDELNRMRVKERYVNQQFVAISAEFKEMKVKLEEFERKGGAANDAVSKLTNELAELTERLDDIKESFESKDSGMHDTSPLVKIKTALQQIKAESAAFDLRIGVVSHSLLATRVVITARKRQGAASKNASRQRRNKHHQAGAGRGKASRVYDDDNSLISDEDLGY